MPGSARNGAGGPQLPKWCRPRAPEVALLLSLPTRACQALPGACAPRQRRRRFERICVGQFWEFPKQKQIRPDLPVPPRGRGLQMRTNRSARCRLRRLSPKPALGEPKQACGRHGHDFRPMRGFETGRPSKTMTRRQEAFRDNYVYDHASDHEKVKEGDAPDL